MKRSLISKVMLKGFYNRFRVEILRKTRRLRSIKRVLIS